ncbi:MAG: hypothetical protein CMM26_10345 [Rhodospirillaceae bacterium]|nr:hypothetical protein [Rhodospirillaceae bacterium]
MSTKRDSFPEVVVYPARSKTLATLFGSLMFAVAAVFFLLTPDIYARLVGAGALVAFGASGLYAAVRLISNAPVVVFNRDGLLDNASPFAVGWMDWAEIARIAPRRTYLARLIGVVPCDLDAVFARVPRHRRWLVRSLASVSQSPVNIPATFLGRRLDEVQQEIRRYHAEFGPPA